MPDAADRSKCLFLAALDLASGPQREAYLDAECAGDSDLRRRVGGLLAAHAATAGPLDRPPEGLSAPGVAAARPGGPGPQEPAAGEAVGPYALLQKLGEGGMGTVWAAEQQAPVRRRVAIKLIKPGMDSRQVLRRFEAERQALALMDHPNIAKVFDAGTTPEGRPYFAMELVEGVPITRYCDEVNLSVRERLELFIPVCRAIQHAHTKGVVHRDVKPSNVLVAVQDGRPVAKVIDFGVAKALHQQLGDRTMHTEVGAVIGTLEYMAPEQAELDALDVDTRADVYALGVLLYELLTGSTPLDRKRLASAGLAEVMRIIREEEPHRPSTRLSESAGTLPGLAAHRRTEPSRLTREIRGDLDWIVMRCLEKDRARRYETANGLARDLERHLADEPVEARPPGSAYRLRKFARRNKGLLAAAALVLLALVSGATAATWQAVRATNAEALADKRYSDERQARKDADAARKAAETEAAKATAVSDLIREMLSSADPDRAKGAEYTVRQLLDDSAARLRGQLDGQPEVEAAVRAAIGNAYRRLGLAADAEPHLTRALAIRRRAADAPGASLGQQMLLAQSLLDYAWNCYESGRRPDAERHAREAVAVHERRGVRTAGTLEALATLHICVDAQGRYAEAEAVANEAIALGRELFPEGHPELASVLHRLAAAKHVLGDAPAAEPLAREAVAMHERWHGKGHAETGWALGVLGAVETGRGRYADAAAHHRRALGIFTNLYGGSHGWTRSARERLEAAVEAWGDPEAVAALRRERALRLPEELEREAADTPEAGLRRAELYLEVGLWDEARPQLDAAAAIAELGAAETLRLAKGYRRLAEGLRAADGRIADELAARAAEVRWRERLVGLDPNAGHRDGLANSHAYRADALLRAGRWDDAIAPLSAAVGLWDELGREDPRNRWYQRERAWWGHHLADALARFGRLDEAISVARENLRLSDRLAAEPPAEAEYRDRAASVRQMLVRLLAAAGRDVTAEFEELMGRTDLRPQDLNGLAWGFISPGPVPPDRAALAIRAAERAAAAAPEDGTIWSTLGVARYRAGDWPGAVDALSRSQELHGDAHLAFTAFFLAMARHRLGDEAEARLWFDRAVEWQQSRAPSNEELRRFRAEAEALFGATASRATVEAARPGATVSVAPGFADDASE